MKSIHAISLPAALLGIVSLLYPDPIHAQTPYTVVFTEVSSTELLESVNGVTLPTTTWTTLAPNEWQWIDLTHTYGLPLSEVQFAEPIGEPGVNLINESTITSEFPLNPGWPLAPLGSPTTTAYNGAPLGIIDSSGFPAPASYEFIDDATETPSVPDASATLPLCGFACLSLVVLRRYVTPHTAAA
ncbi:MAG TPA: hypothetical protein VN829_14280 [Dongiaceae bacterium]|nr:hypothetical protein [Dongiaceae bacterium]